MAGHFLAESSNASVQHIAFATDDIFASAQRLEACGFAPLPIARNYYADLAARFDIDAATLARLRAQNILYDEDARGKFFQLYSRPFADGRCCQTNENSHRIACAALIYALNSWRHSVRAAVRLSLKLSRE